MVSKGRPLFWTSDMIDAYVEDLERPNLRRDRLGRRPSLDYYDNRDPVPDQKMKEMKRKKR